jgi:hypothetical protein
MEVWFVTSNTCIVEFPDPPNVHAFFIKQSLRLIEVDTLDYNKISI